MQRKNTKIPRMIHQIWLGANKLPLEFLEYQQTWLNKNKEEELLNTLKILFPDLTL